MGREKIRSQKGGEVYKTYGRSFIKKRESHHQRWFSTQGSGLEKKKEIKLGVREYLVNMSRKPRHLAMRR